MKNEMTAEEYKSQLNSIVNELIDFYNNNTDFSITIYIEWSAKDVLGHIVMWHESFARNLSDIVKGIKPNPLKGSLSELNEKGVIENRNFSIEELLIKLKIANEIIMTNILNDQIKLIPYRKGSRDYSRDEHMEVVYRHIKGHLADLQKKYK